MSDVEATAATGDRLPGCQEFLARHSEYVDGRMGSPTMARWQEHLAACPSCARYDRIVREGARRFRALDRATLSPDFDFRLRHRLLHVEEEERTRDTRSATTAAAAVLVAGVLAALAWSPFLRHPAPVAPAATETADAAATTAQAPAAAPLRVYGPDVASMEVHHVTPLLPPIDLNDGNTALLGPPMLAAPLFAAPGSGYLVQPGSYSPLIVAPPGFRLTSTVRRLGAPTTH